MEFRLPKELSLFFLWFYVLKSADVTNLPPTKVASNCTD